jgi:L-ascorbate metabolism protein UlaG (beta-lactamase superfamily)
MTLSLTVLGHASLLIEGAGALVCDPILGDAISGGGNLIDPPRRIHAAELPYLDAILLSHHHSDHFDLRELARLKPVSSGIVLVPQGSPVIEPLLQLGFVVDQMNPGDRRSIVGIGITATPSSVDFPEIGFRFDHDKASVLNLVDTQFHRHVEELRREKPPVLALVPFQAGGYMSLLPLRAGGPPKGLVSAIRAWSSEYTTQLTDDIAALTPKHAAAFADGISYRDETINRWHFPLPGTNFVTALAERGISASISGPGTFYRVTGDDVCISEDRRGLVEPVGHAVNRGFDPTVELSHRPLARGGVCRGIYERRAIEGELEHLLENAQARLAALPQTQRSELSRLCNDWWLELCDVEPAGCCLSPVVAEGRVSATMLMGAPARRMYGIRAHWCDLFDVLRGRCPLEHVLLSGAFRYFSPVDVDSLEAIRARVLSPLEALFECVPPRSMQGLVIEG